MDGVGGGHRCNVTGLVDDKRRGPRLEFDVLGPVQVRIDGIAPPLGGPKQRAVLAALIVNRNRSLSADALADGVWDHRPPPEARASLQVFISNLRRMMRNAGIDARAVLVSAPPGYRLVVPDEDCDLGRFLAEKRAGIQAAATRRFEDASRHFAAALGEWKGSALEDLLDLDFAKTFAAAIEEEKLLALAARAEAEIACGRAESVIAELMSLASVYPLREPLWGQLITALYVCGRQSDALGACRRLRSNLAEELGIDPGRELLELEGRILRQEPLAVVETARATAAHTVTVLETLERAVAAQLRDGQGRTFRIGSAEIRIGRMPDNDIVLVQSKVSRHHAIIVNTGMNFVLRDLRSSNGVYVRGNRVVDSVWLVDGDIIRIGDNEYVFEIVVE
ncbi:BTAD domain-containing putative transcriptional regulator [Rhodococcus sp. NPDC059968]|uniref:BTAD domain-containing putative transcriptional regulator n=1 Tax=Rhodococcus sp. NPDC059968 TaxID=3347017 RepID=UPI0036709AB6